MFKSKLVHVPLGPTIEPQLASDLDRRRVRARFGATDADIVIAYFGFVSPSKGIETLLRAFDRARREHSDVPLRLLLIASREPSDPTYVPYHRRIEQVLGELPTRGLVHWTGYCPPRQVSEYLASADLAVLPYADGASLRRTTMLSALAHGLPVLSTGEASPCPGVRVTPIGNIDALSTAIIQLARAPAAREILAAQARCAAAGLGWDTVARKTLVVFNDVLNRDERRD